MAILHLLLAMHENSKVSVNNKWSCCVQTPIHVERPLENVVFKSLTLKTVHGRKIFHTWRETEKFFAEKK